MRKPLVLLSLMLFGSNLFAVQGAASKVSNLKIMQTRRLLIYTSGEFKHLAPGLAREGEAFLDRLEARWSVQLPEEQYAVTLAKGTAFMRPATHVDGPDWLQSTYNRERQRILLQCSEIPDEEQIHHLAKAMNHLLIHRLLNSDYDNQLPVFLEEGLAQYYGHRERSRDKALVIWGFHRNPSLINFLGQDVHFTNDRDYPYAAALSRRYVEWLWTSRPGSEIAFIQKFLTKRPVKKIYADLGWPADEVLLEDFNREVRPYYSPYSLLLTLDFWFIICGGGALLWMGWTVTKAARFAFSDFVGEEKSPEDTSYLFEGPAFGGESLETPAPTEEPLVLNLTPAQEENPISLPPLPPTVSDAQPISLPEIPGEPAPISLPPLPLEQHSGSSSETEVDLAALEEDLDGVFDNLIADRKKPDKKSERGSGAIEEDLDQIFDNWHE